MGGCCSWVLTCLSYRIALLRGCIQHLKTHVNQAKKSWRTNTSPGLCDVLQKGVALVLALGRATSLTSAKPDRLHLHNAPPEGTSLVFSSFPFLPSKYNHHLSFS